jgi:hypothetical protein
MSSRRNQLLRYTMAWKQNSQRCRSHHDPPRLRLNGQPRAVALIQHWMTNLCIEHANVTFRIESTTSVYVHNCITTGTPLCGIWCLKLLEITRPILWYSGPPGNSIKALEACDESSACTVERVWTTCRCLASHMGSMLVRLEQGFRSIAQA